MAVYTYCARSISSVDSDNSEVNEKQKDEHFLLRINITGRFSVKVDLTQFKKYSSLCNPQVNGIDVCHLLNFSL